MCYFKKLIALFSHFSKKKKIPIDSFGKSKANLYLTVETVPPNKYSNYLLTGFMGERLSPKEGKKIAEEFMIQHLIGEKHVTEKGYLLDGFLKDLPTIKAYIIFEPSTIQQLLNLCEQYRNYKSEKNIELAHVAPELGLPDQPYGLPEDSILWDKKRQAFYLQWCRKLFHHQQKLKNPHLSTKLLNLELFRQQLDDMGTWRF
ncbi:MAG: hypothetical protein WCV58_01230 [Patescibacteria group bacterium]|jgi:hypothetical protein